MRHAQSTARRFGGLCVTEHRFELPLRADGSGALEVFAREVVDATRDPAGRPWLVFLQGGPGSAAPRPTTHSGWIGRAVEDYRVLLLDQRGTGLSSPATFETLEPLGTAAAQAEHLTHFRADGIARDCEAIRALLAGPDTPWTVLGQSFGGFCAVHYLSRAPEGLAAALITGGLPPLVAHADAVYRRTIPLVLEANRRFYARYPEDEARVRRIVDVLSGKAVRLPCGDRLTPRRFLALGLQLGFSDGFEIIHNLVECAFVPGTDELAYAFLRGFENALYYDINPLFSLLQEACYAQGFATRWSAARVSAEFPELDHERARGPVPFTGELIFPWMFEDVAVLRPLRQVAELLAEKEDWPPLYDLRRLAANAVPAAAAVYVDDMYVERGFSEETAASIRGLSAWVTEDHLHNALRADGRLVLDELFSRLPPIR